MGGSFFVCCGRAWRTRCLSAAIAAWAARIQPARIRPFVASAAVAVVAALALLRSFDLITNRHYFHGTDESSFGTGLGWWFPQRAAEFIEREKVPGEIFNTYDEGGYLTWKLGPERHDYIDGRAIPFGVVRMQRHGQLLASPPDSPLWQEEVASYNINTVILPLARHDGISLVRLQDFCKSKVWKPVYLDEVSAVFVRRTAQTEDLLQRFPVDCATAPLPLNHRAAAARSLQCVGKCSRRSCRAGPQF